MCHRPPPGTECKNGHTAKGVAVFYHPALGEVCLRKVFCFAQAFLARRPAKARITPRAMPNAAANTTWKWAGNIKVMVCAGIQKKGMVF